MSRISIVYIVADKHNQMHTLRMRQSHVRFETFDPVAWFRAEIAAMIETGQWPELDVFKAEYIEDELDFNIIAILYGDITIVDWSEDISNEPGKIYRESAVTRISLPLGGWREVNESQTTNV